MDPFHLILPKSRLRDFMENPFDYLLRASGMKSKALNTRTTVLNLQEDNEVDVPILPLLSDDEDDDEELLQPSPVIVDQHQKERSDSFAAEQEAMQAADADIPDADQLGNSPRSLI